MITFSNAQVIGALATILTVLSLLPDGLCAGLTLDVPSSPEN
jgi:hypothetical protein